MLVVNFRSFYSLTPRPPTSTLFPYTTLFRSDDDLEPVAVHPVVVVAVAPGRLAVHAAQPLGHLAALAVALVPHRAAGRDRKSTRLNSSHVEISYAVFCLKKKKKYYTLCTVNT